MHDVADVGDPHDRRDVVAPRHEGHQSVVGAVGDGQGARAQCRQVLRGVRHPPAELLGSRGRLDESRRAERDLLGVARGLEPALPVGVEADPEHEPVVARERERSLIGL